MLIDSHAHITSDELIEDVQGLIQRAKDAQLEKIINICTDQQTALRGVELNTIDPFVVNAGATTPHDVNKLGEVDFPFFEKLALEKKLIAIGETGLDYFYEHSDKDAQIYFLIKYFNLAKKTGLPVVVHCREAFSDLFQIADGFYGSEKLLIHCFTGTKEEAFQALDRGYKISISGIVTFKKSTDLQEVVKSVPLESLLVETDSPYLAPQSKRGTTNEPAYVVETAEFISKLKGVDFETFCEQTRKNTKEFFSI